MGSEMCMLVLPSSAIPNCQSHGPVPSGVGQLLRVQRALAGGVRAPGWG